MVWCVHYVCISQSTSINQLPINHSVGSTFWGHYEALVEKEATIRKAQEAMKAARRNTMRVQKQVEAARLSRRRSMKKMTKEEVKQKMMSPVQERAFHQLFAMSSSIEELLGKIRSCQATSKDMQNLMNDPRNLRILAEMSTTE